MSIQFMIDYQWACKLTKMNILAPFTERLYHGLDSIKTPNLEEQLRNWTKFHWQDKEFDTILKETKLFKSKDNDILLSDGTIVTYGQLYQMPDMPNISDKGILEYIMSFNYLCNVGAFIEFNSQDRRMAILPHFLSNILFKYSQIIFNAQYDIIKDEAIKASSKDLKIVGCSWEFNSSLESPFSNFYYACQGCRGEDNPAIVNINGDNYQVIDRGYVLKPEKDCPNESQKHLLLGACIFRDQLLQKTFLPLLNLCKFRSPGEVAPLILYASQILVLLQTPLCYSFALKFPPAYRVTKNKRNGYPLPSPHS